jgi:prepilin signal peptidase PulO-like enzyme (type II secretory pathway)
MLDDPYSPFLTVLAALLGGVLGLGAATIARRYACHLVTELAAPEHSKLQEKPTQAQASVAADHEDWRRESLVGIFLGAVILPLLALRFGPSVELTLATGFCLALLTLALIDHRLLLLPDSLTLPLVWLGLLSNIPAYFVSLQDAVIGAVLGYGSLWGIYWLFKLIRGKEGLGYGDFKLTAALGAWLGWQALPGIIFTAALAGACVGLLQVVGKKRQRDQPMPFGPFLAAAGFVALCTGSLGPWLLSV